MTAIAIGVAGCSGGSAKPSATPVQLTAATPSYQTIDARVTVEK